LRLVSHVPPYPTRCLSSCLAYERELPGKLASQMQRASAYGASEQMHPGPFDPRRIPSLGEIRYTILDPDKLVFRSDNG
jgi:hypothetical protein